MLHLHFLLFVDGNVRDLEEAIEIAKSGLDSGKASENLEHMAKISQQLAGI